MVGKRAGRSKKAEVVPEDDLMGENSEDTMQNKSRGRRNPKPENNVEAKKRAGTAKADKTPSESSDVDDEKDTDSKDVVLIEDDEKSDDSEDKNDQDQKRKQARQKTKSPVKAKAAPPQRRGRQQKAVPKYTEEPNSDSDVKLSEAESSEGEGRHQKAAKTKTTPQRRGREQKAAPKYTEESDSNSDVKLSEADSWEEEVPKGKKRGRAPKPKKIIRETPKKRDSRSKKSVPKYKEDSSDDDEEETLHKKRSRTSHSQKSSGDGSDADMSKEVRIVLEHCTS